MKKSILPLLFLSILISLFSCNEQKSDAIEQNHFKFAFITDIHLQPERRATEGFLQAIDTINELKPDFVITGGDLIMDALGQTYGRADSLYTLYNKTAANFKMPVYNTLGNHEIYGIYEKSGADRSHPEFGEKMFEKEIGESYYSFNHKGWHFIILNSVEETYTGNAYEGFIDAAQMEWLKSDLEKVNPETPIAISTHIPLTTVYWRIYDSPNEPNKPNIAVKNTPELLKLFENHNLKLVLQGHMHVIEEVKVNGITFITGGAASAAWWTGPHQGFEEGFVLVDVNGDDFSWEYVDYGWVAQSEK
jgi:predicted MPP superfamily phosphohydrolase